MTLRISSSTAATVRHPHVPHLGHVTTTAHTAVQVATSTQPSIQLLTVASVLAVVLAMICMFTIALYAHAKIQIRIGALNMTNENHPAPVTREQPG
jgi:hypothetical protein